MRASLVAESAIIYLCMLYCGILIIGQHLIRKHTKNFGLYMLFHLALIIPCALFAISSELDLIITGIVALISTFLSFRRSVMSAKKSDSPKSEPMHPATVLVFPLFAIAGRYYGHSIFCMWVFIESIIYLLLYAGYTLYINEELFLRDHIATANIPGKRIHALTKRIRIIFSAVIVFVMLIVSGVNISLPGLGFKTEYTISSDKTVSDSNSNIDFNMSEIVAEEPSALAIILGYIVAFVISLLIIVAIIVIVVFVIRELYGSIGGQRNETISRDDEDEDITIESLSPFGSKKKGNKKRVTDNSLKIRKLYHDYVLKNMSKADRALAKTILSPKTPEEIDAIIAAKSSEVSGTTSIASGASSLNSSGTATGASSSTASAIRDIYEEVRYSNREPDSAAVDKMRTYTK